MSTRTIPRAQAIYPYGIGAIVDWGQECFVVQDTTRGGWSKGPRIEMPRLQRILKAPEGFRLPPLARDGRSHNPLAVTRFPAWLFCPSCRVMIRWSRDLEVKCKGAVPRCEVKKCRDAVLVPMRYVAVCDAGHLADVDWWKVAHSTSTASQNCSKQTGRLYFDIIADKGSSLDGLAVRCAQCQSRKTLGGLLNESALKAIGMRCPGRQPWQSYDDREDCARPLHVLQRSQTAVHYADIVSAIDLSKNDDDVAGQDAIFAIVRQIWDALSLTTLEELVPHRDAISKKAQRRVDISEIEACVRRILGNSNEASVGLDEEDLLLEEWDSLATPTLRGPGRPKLLVREEVAAHANEWAWKGLVKRVNLVERLRVVRAFRGFRRIAPDATLVTPSLGKVDGKAWLPASEVFGEGIFLEIDGEALEKWEQVNRDALAARCGPIGSVLRADGNAIRRFQGLAAIASRFIAIHTFSHLLMRQMCFESGYGGAALQERLYVYPDRAGVLIYTAAGDSEGSLGGLVRLGQRERLSRTIAVALERSTWCSNDPICSEMSGHGFKQLSRAACHACALVPETGCSHLNTLLDRQLVIGDGRGGAVRGFFANRQ